eukprot:TRINITY_DN77_c0_g1_i1.p1 TRINITY_DN77_c0_g1~~TRINITY_DN77_c0_g1_i1.p1  ORF type:complete len:606 (+),score=218.34 TRINITY_DN77_c0_g1_i1:36-1853(+)
MQKQGGSVLMKKIVSLSKRRGFIYPGSELYGGLQSSFDYGPLGVQLKKNIVDRWWSDFIVKRRDCVGIDTSIMMNSQVWRAAGHVDHFVDPMVECKHCRHRFRTSSNKPSSPSSSSSASSSSSSSASASVSSSSFSSCDSCSSLSSSSSSCSSSSTPTSSLSFSSSSPSSSSLSSSSSSPVNASTKSKRSKTRKSSLSRCPVCGGTELSEPRDFNLLFETQFGCLARSSSSSSSSISSSSSSSSSPSSISSTVFLRPETAQGIFVNFKKFLPFFNRLPFGVGQIGKSFRNEISPSDFVFRMREFSQMELEYFCHPSTAQKHYEEWVQRCMQWLIHSIGLSPHSLRPYVYPSNELAHYAVATTDIQFQYPFGWQELWGIANRGDFDLKKHAQASGQSLEFADPHTREKVVPYVIEPALGLDRLILSVLCDSYVEERLSPSSLSSSCSSSSSSSSSASAPAAAATAVGLKKKPLVDHDSMRVVLKMQPDLAPYRFAVLPLNCSDSATERAALEVYERIASSSLSCHSPICYDDIASIGRRYRRQDEIGTPFCISVDELTVRQNLLTLRDRDSRSQIHIHNDDFLHRVRSGASLTTLFPEFKKLASSS